MPETQNLEYKSSWRDEFLKEICGFANAQGGTLFIGKDDKENIVGVKNAEKLLEDLSNKITTILGIICDVNLHETKQGEYIEIVVEPQPNPVNYKGKYHYRSDIANAFFRCGYVESWGRGIEKITEQCATAGLPMPIFSNEGSDFWVTFRKDIYNLVDLSLLGLSDRQIKAVLYVKEKGRITNLEYLEINKGITDRTALRDLDFLIERGVFQRIGEKKAAYYELVNVGNVG